MLRTKADVDRHVQSLLRKVKSDNERNLRCFNIAQLYFKVQDYESARHYVSMYLSIRCDSASAHKLYGQALEHLGLKEKALAAYKKSLEIEGNQADLVLKMCEILCDKEIVFDPVKAHYWAERASTMFPHSPVVFMLKEKLLSAGTTKNCEDFENLFQSELKARPTDTAVRVKLLRLYVDTDRVDVAYNHAFENEFKQEPSNHIPWYHCLNHICDAYLKAFPNECNWEFYMRWMAAVDRLCSLCMSETLMQPSNLVESTEVVYNFDQVLFKGSQLQGKSPEFYKELVKHFSAQLAFHTAVLLLKRAKKESSLWKEVKRMVSPLLLFASSEVLIPEGAWNFTIKDNYQKFLKLCTHHAQCRVVQAGHVLCSLSKDNHSEKLFLDKVTHFTSNNNWRNQIFQKVFRTLENNNPSTSHLVTANFYNEAPRKLPSNLNLKPSFFVPSFEVTYMGSLHHLVWLGLQSLTNSGSPVSCKLSPGFYSTFFKTLQVTVNNLHNTGVETLNQLDVDSFLYAAVFCAGAVIDDQKANGYNMPEKPHIFPPDITPLLCTTEQAKWWTNACSIVKVGMPVLSFKNKVYDIRHNLQRGIEVVRGEGMQLALVVSLARTFSARASEVDCDEDKSKACEARALHLWRVAIPQLEKLADFEPVIQPGMKLFEYPIKELTPDEVTNLLEEGRFFIACHYMKMEQFENAIETFKKLRTPQSLFQQALIYQKLAKDQLTSLRGEEITSEIRSRHVVMAAKARDCLYSVRDMIKGDRNHPLQQKLKCKLMEIDDLLSRFGPENDVTERDGYLSDTSPSFASGGSPTGDTNNIQQHMHSHSHSRIKHFPSSTPNKYYDVRHRSSSADIAELITVNLNTSQLKTQQFVLEQSRLVLERLDNIKSEQRAQRTLLEDLGNKFMKLEAEIKGNLNDIKKEIKRPDLYNMLEEEDYNDDMLHYPNIPFYPQRGVQGTNTVTYGAPVAPFFSPRVDQVYPNNMGFYNQGALPFPDGQQVSDFLRTMPPQTATLTHKLGAPAMAGPNLGAATLGLGVGPTPGGSVSPLSGLQPPPAQTHKLPTHPQVPQPRPIAPQHIAQAPTNVVITTSDTLPTGTPPVQPTLSVTIPPQHRLATTPALPHNFQIPMPTDIKTVDRSPVVQEDLELDEEVVEHDPIPDFRPIIPLPDEVDVKTGEENEQVLFESRAKLFRYVEKDWKERGTGTLKILRDDTTGKSRILMRRDQVHKVCANHFLTPDMKLEPMKSTDNAWIWFANDFADEKVELVNLCAKFKTAEDKNLFKTVFNKAKLGLKESSEDDSLKTLNMFKSPPEPPKQTPGLSFFTPSFGTTANAVKTDLTIPTSRPADTQPQPAVSSSGGVVNLGGFTILAPPKLKLDEKKETPKVIEEKKPENPLATFSFRTPVISDTVQTRAVEEKKPEGAAPAPAPFTFTFTPKTSAVPFSGFGTSANTVFGQPQQPKPEEKKPETLFGSGASGLAPGLAQNKPPEEKKTETMPSSTHTFGSFTFDNLNICSPTVQKPQTKAGPEPQKETPPVLTPPRFSFGGEQKTPITPATGFGIGTQPGKGFEGAGSQVFGSAYQTPSPSVLNKSGGGMSSPSCPEDEFTPTAEFKPVIPLPKLVEIKSGEENETVLYTDERAKLLRYCRETKQWKERGIGQMKILKDPNTGVVRLLMRREQVLKVCCNHRLTKDMVLKSFMSSEKTYTWAALQDFSDETPKNEIFMLKFKTAEQARRFKAEFEKAQAGLVPSPKKDDLQKAEETICSACNGKGPCSNCEKTQSLAPKGLTFDSQKKQLESGKPSLSSLFKPKPNTWECQACFVRSDSAKTKCEACGTWKPGCEQKEPETVKPSLSSLFKPKPNTWECQGCFVRNDSAKTKCEACGTWKPGCDQKQTEPEAQQTTTTTGGFSFGLTGQNFSGTGFSFGTSQSTGVAPAAPQFGTSPAATFTFGAPKPESFLPPMTLAPASAPGAAPTAAPSAQTGTTGFVFGNQPLATQPIANRFGFCSEKFQFTMPSSNTTVTPAADNNTSKAEESGSEHEDEEDNGDHITFTPAVPLPEKVPIITGEEDEEVLYVHKAKLYRYDNKSKEWKERGTGDIKILKHKQNGKMRLLMRREHTMKVCLNHYLTQDIEMKPQTKQSWIWNAADFADGDITQETLAIKFKTPEIAKEFKAAVDDALAQYLGTNTNSNKTLAQGAATKHDLEDNIQSGVVTSNAGESLDEVAPKNLSKFSLTAPREDVQPSKDESLSGGDAIKQPDQDVEIVYENDVSQEDKDKALALKLPPKFYLYKKAPPCPGCVGCEPEEDESSEKASEEYRNKEPVKNASPEEVVVQQEVKVEAQPPRTNIFGGVISSPSIPIGQSPQPITTNLFGSVKQGSTPKTSFFPKEMTSFTTSSPLKTTFGNNLGGNTTPLGSGFISANPQLSFSSLTTAGVNKEFSKPSDFRWPNADSTVFGARPNETKEANKDDKEKGDENADEDEADESTGDASRTEEHDPHFEPLIPLPKEIEIKTGEEDEDLVFCERAKLFRRADNKEWKERGVGSLKVLKHKTTCRYRLLMRREMVHKIVCNHLITADLQMNRLSTSESSWCWAAMNLSDDQAQPQLELLAVRFKTKEIALAFKSIIQSAIENTAALNTSGQDNSASFSSSLSTTS